MARIGTKVDTLVVLSVILIVSSEAWTWMSSRTVVFAVCNKWVYTLAAKQQEPVSKGIPASYVENPVLVGPI